MTKKEKKVSFTDEIVSKIIKFAGHLISIEKIENILGLEKGSIKHYAEKSSDFNRKLENAALQLDLDVETAIYKRAVGYQTTEEHKTYLAVYSDKNDKNGEIEEPEMRLKEIKYVRKFVPPETSSGLTWLYNKQGEKWSKNPAVSNDVSNEELQILKKRASEIAEKNL